MQLVLLIETNLHALKEFAAHLSGNRFRLVDTTSTKKGLDYAKSAPPDLIIIGFQPQEREPVETLIFLKKDPITKLIPILALIHDLNQPFVEYLQKIGVTGYLPKPITKRALVQKVNELLSVSENIRANIVKQTVHHVAVSVNTDERVIIIFRSGIKNYVLPEIRRVINHDFIKNSINKHIAIDLRTLPEITLEEMELLEKILNLFGKKRIALITGMHMGNIMKNSDLPDHINLFLSIEDYELFLQNPDLDE